MKLRAAQPRRRADFHAAEGVLLVLREPPAAAPARPGQPAAVPGDPAEGPEVLLAVWDDGSATALHGHVDLGTGIATALAQLVAEELDLPVAQVHMVLGSTSMAPNQGATIASASIQVHAAPLRAAAAQARAWLRASGAASLAHALAGRHVELMLALDTPLKPQAEHRIVGQSLPRIDIPAKFSGELVFVHDMRVPGMLHGRVVRPPYAGADHGDFIGNTLDAVDESSIAHIPGLRAVVVIRDFIGVVAEREEHAEQAARELRVRWKPWPGLPEVGDLEHALRTNPSTRRTLVDEGDVDAALKTLAQPLPRTYVWPYQLHASLGPSCALADCSAAGGTVWAGTQNPHVLRADLARLLGVADAAITVERMEAAGCYGRNGADDVAADAALLSRAVGAPVRVQLSREQENAWEPKGAAQLMQVDGGLGSQGELAAWSFNTRYPSNGAPTLALLLTRTIEPLAQAFEMGDRTARPPYSVPNLRVTVDDMAPLLRASWLRGVSALPNSFAHESYIDELATAAGADPVAFRLQHLNDERASELLRATAARAGWQAHTAAQQRPARGDVLHGQGVAYARYTHSAWPGYGSAWAAWVADVDVNRVTGEVHVRRVVVGHDAGLVVNPAGVEQQVHGNVIQTTSRALLEEVRGDAPAGAGQGAAISGGIRSLEWGSYPILSFREVPVIEVLQMPHPGEAPLGAGESASVPGTAAIANAIFDATGVRFRQPPFTPEVVRAALNPKPAPVTAGFASPPSSQPAAPLLTPTATGSANAPWPRAKRLPRRSAALLLGAAGTAAALLGWRPAIAPVDGVAAGTYSAATLERGRVLAAVGNCAGCHTAPGGERNAGGLTVHTRFGTLYTTNITPDAATGIGRWSFSAFQRAMRDGIGRDGRHLYPALPYTAFARTTDDDLQALYGHLMSQPPARAEAPPNALRFPFNVRPLLAGWNALFHDAGQPLPTPGRSSEWQRGEYLVEGLGHCAGCHTPRNALGAVRTGPAHFAGALVDGWEAPALTAAAPAPVPWTADALFNYLRHGYSAEHGTAGGPMAQVVRELAPVPDADLRAMATYLASFHAEAPADTAQLARDVVAHAAAQAPLPDAAGRLFDGACGACHHDGNGPMQVGTNTPLALSTQLHSDRPDNLIRTVLDGVREPAGPRLGFMPAFRHSLSDAQIAELLAHMRQRFAPGKPAWTRLGERVAALRLGEREATPP